MSGSRRRLARLTATLVVAVVAFPLAGCGGDPSAASDVKPATDATTASGQSEPGASLPATFFGIVAPEVLPAPEAGVDQALDAQAKAGIKLFRQPFLWPEIEPERGKFNFANYDRLVGRAAHFGITIMPIVFGVRPGDGAAKQPGATITDTTTMPPKSDERFAAYASVLVRRYGRGGTFWAEHPDVPALPVTAWQVWNEPNLPAYWGGDPDPAAYAKLLKTTAAAIREADPKAEILTGGLPDSKIGTPLLTFVRQMVEAGAAGSFDTLAVHPYAQTAAGVLDGAEQAQRVAERAGATDVNLWITEIGWATGGPGSSFTVSESAQASLVTELVQLAADRATELRLHGVVYYAWRDSPVYPGGEDFWGLYTGLVKRDNTVKPALSSFAATVNALG